MKDIKLKDIVIPLSDYATVSEEETLATAINVLKQSQKDTKYKYKHRAVVVYGKNNHITGKVSLFDILKALEPKYRHFEYRKGSESVGLSRFGLNSDFLKSFVDDFSLWDETLDELVKKASKRRVKEIMYSPSEDEYIDIDTPIAEALHKFILGHHQSLLVRKEDKVVGILRVTDIFILVCDVLEL